MATTYPNTVQTFPVVQNITESDGAIVKQYQIAMQNDDLALAQTLLNAINNGNAKIITAELLNTISDTTVAIENEYLKRYNPSITVSQIAPINPAVGDYWWEVK